jgi:FHS family L-fucose permease-like MFS transporter
VALLISRVKLPSFQTAEDEIEKGFGAFQFTHLKFGVFAMFCYVGGEVAVGSFIISFFGTASGDEP